MTFWLAVSLTNCITAASLASRTQPGRAGLSFDLGWSQLVEGVGEISGVGDDVLAGFGDVLYKS